MEALSEAIRAGIERLPEGLQDACEAWAVHALQTYRGRLLHKALGVSEALSNFLTELQHGAEGDDERLGEK